MIVEIIRNKLKILHNTFKEKNFNNLKDFFIPACLLLNIAILGVTVFYCIRFFEKRNMYCYLYAIIALILAVIIAYIIKKNKINKEILLMNANRLTIVLLVVQLVVFFFIKVSMNIQERIEPFVYNVNDTVYMGIWMIILSVELLVYVFYRVKCHKKKLTNKNIRNKFIFVMFRKQYGRLILPLGICGIIPYYIASIYGGYLNTIIKLLSIELVDINTNILLKIIVWILWILYKIGMAYISVVIFFILKEQSLDWRDATNWIMNNILSACALIVMVLNTIKVLMEVI